MPGVAACVFSWTTYLSSPPHGSGVFSTWCSVRQLPDLWCSFLHLASLLPTHIFYSHMPCLLSHYLLFSHTRTFWFLLPLLYVRDRKTCWMLSLPLTHLFMNHSAIWQTAPSYPPFPPSLPPFSHACFNSAYTLAVCG